jgi:hypothetical protein
MARTGDRVDYLESFVGRVCVTRPHSTARTSRLAVSQRAVILCIGDLAESREYGYLHGV